MISLPVSAEDECLLLQLRTLEFAIRNQSRRVESETWEIEGLKVQSVIEREPALWKRTWLLDGHRIGWNALVFKFREARKSK